MLNNLRAVLILPASRIALGLTLAWALPSSAQEDLFPRGPRVEVDRDCAVSPIPFEVDGETLVAWYRWGADSGIWARRGPRLDGLEPAVKLVDETPSTFQVAARPGAFVLVWVGDDWPDPALTFQRFGADLAPEGPPVVVGKSEFFSTPAVAVDAAGNVTIAWTDDGLEVKVRRYSSADLPLTPEIVVQTAALGATGIWLAAGDAGFLVAWSEYLVLPAGNTHYRARAYSPAGAPLGPFTELGEMVAPAFIRSTLQLAAVDGGYLAVRLGGLARLLGADGTPLGPETPLGVAADSQGIRMAGGPEGVWLAWHTINDIFASHVDPSTLTAEPPTLLASNQPQRLNLTSIGTRGSGLMAGWNIHLSSIILPSPPCDWGEYAYSQEFGPPPAAVEVPTLSKTGLVLCALAFAIAGVLMRRVF
jgi:hypothetical protein